VRGGDSAHGSAIGSDLCLSEQCAAIPSPVVRAQPGAIADGVAVPGGSLSGRLENDLSRQTVRQENRRPQGKECGLKLIAGKVARRRKV
jgi:hypothetical protein